MSSPLVVFDLDGTLIDSQQDLADAANALIVELGGQPVPVEAIGRMVGDGAAVLVRRALAATGVHVGSVRGALDRFLVLYDERLLASTRLYDGMAEAIDAFADVAQLAVLTNKPERATRRILEGLAIAERFDRVIGGDGPFPRKPDPAGLHHLVAQAGVSLGRAIMIGDSSVDLATARAAGTRVCLARYGFGYRLTSADLRGDELIADSPAEILARLRESFL
jgi:phosphoglycolate phosphatase